MRNLEFYNQDNIYEKYNNERKSNNRKKSCYFWDKDEHLVYQFPFNSKNPHNNV